MYQDVALPPKAVLYAAIPPMALPARTARAQSSALDGSGPLTDPVRITPPGDRIAHSGAFRDCRTEVDTNSRAVEHMIDYMTDGPGDRIDRDRQGRSGATIAQFDATTANCPRVPAATIGCNACSVTVGLLSTTGRHTHA